MTGRRVADLVFMILAAALAAYDAVQAFTQHRTWLLLPAVVLVFFVAYYGRRFFTPGPGPGP